MSGKSKLILVVVMIAATILVGGGATYFIYFSWYKSTEERIAALRTVVERMRDHRDNRERMQRDLETAQANNDRAARRIPDVGSAIFGDFPTHVEQLARRAGVTIGEAKKITAREGRRGANMIRGVTIPDTVMRADYSIVHGGGFYELLRFLHLLETSEYYVMVRQIGIEPVDQEIATATNMVIPEGGGPKGASLTITIFAYRAPASAGASSGARPPARPPTPPAAPQNP